MKYYIFTIIFIFSLFSLKSQTTEEEQIKQIREWYAQINEKIKNLVPIKYDMSYQTTEGGTLSVYYYDSEIILLEAEFYGETGNYKSYHYFKDSNVFFIFTVKQLYSAQINAPNNSVATNEENRYYFWDKKMIRWLDPQKNKVSKDSEAFKKEEIKILEYTQQLENITIQNNYD